MKSNFEFLNRYWPPLAQIGETAENAVIREIQEELNITAKIARPLWLNQAFFNEEVDHLNYHELCIYFLVDISKTDLLSRGEQFVSNEGRRKHIFQWLELKKLKDDLYPSKDYIFDSIKINNKIINKKEIIQRRGENEKNNYLIH